MELSWLDIGEERQTQVYALEESEKKLNLPVSELTKCSQMPLQPRSNWDGPQPPTRNFSARN